MINKKTAIIMLLLFILLVLQPIASTHAVNENADRSEVIFVLLEKPKQLKKIESLLANSEIEVKKIQEIGFLRLEGDVEQLEKCVRKAENIIDLSWYKEFPESSDANMFQNRSNWDLDGIEELNAYLWYAEIQTNNYATYNIQQGNPEVSIALLDSGVDLSNEQFGEMVNSVNGWNYVDGDGNIQDQSGHGTQVAGILNLLAPKISIVPYKIMNTDGGNSFDLLSAIVRATNDGNQVINISAGSYIQMDHAGQILLDAYQRAADYANKNQVMIVASSGNRFLNSSDSEYNEIHVPSMLEHVISVGAVTKSNRLAPYSNFGSYIDFVAYGGYLGDNFDTTGEVDVTDLMLTSFPGLLPNSPLDSILNIPQGFSLSYGTSLAAPQVSAAAGLLISNYYDKYHQYPPKNKIIKLMEQKAVDLGDPGRDNQFGYGEVLVQQMIQ
ncbi:S8 family serine peptidase [Paenibacillus sp. FSL R7-0204]|uniref:S8 family peptidase n=1 Tax=Paenibacillus sp. FSL R7-0204 TaxID=2921675 RepID=UPI0030F5A1D9